MALNKLKFSSINVTPVANQAIKFNSSANGFETGSAGGAITFIKKLTASSSSTLSFVDGSSDVVLDNTYKEYLFIFNNIHPATDGEDFSVNFRDGGSSYDATKTTTYFYTEHGEGGQAGTVGYLASRDEAQSTDAQHLTTNIGRTGEDCASGTLHLYDPSNTTFVKHFVSKVSNLDTTSPGYNQVIYAAGYCNVTAAIDGVQFTMSSGNITAGTIKMYGVV